MGNPTNPAATWRFDLTPDGKLDRLPELAAELVQLHVDAIVTAAMPAAQAAQAATRTIPIVMVDPGDPVSTGLVVSLARPGGNATGLSSISPDLSAKNLELLWEAVPQLSRVAFLWNAASRDAELALPAVQSAARALGIEIQSVNVHGAEEFERAFAAVTREHAAALLVFPDPLTFSHRGRPVEQPMKFELIINRKTAEALGLTLPSTLLFRADEVIK